ncbi:hypothetical protein QCD79_34485, partial [Pseudomonas quasicaspiana]|nr:hypothetical protein [Pseudomonas quasicaspiana]
AQWLRPITVEDQVKLTRRLLVEGGVGRFAEALAAAAPAAAGGAAAASASAKRPTPPSTSKRRVSLT